MSIRIIRFGTPRLPGEGPRLGTVRRPPRGVRKEEYGRRDYFDLWLPDLAPSAPIVKWALAERWTPARWARYTRLYRGEMSEPAATRLIALLAMLSHTTDFSVGCYCDDATHCHRALLADLLAQAGASVDSGDDARAAPAPSSR